MKKLKLLLFGLIALATVSSCSPISTSNKTDIPAEVIKLRDNKSFDTTISVSTDKRTYVFDRKSPANDYVTTIDKVSYENSSILAGLIIGVLLTLFIMSLFKY